MSYFFYKHDGTQVKFNEEKFIKAYEQSYYLHKKDCSFYIPRVSVNSRIAEKRADELLANGIEKGEDVAFILAWKIGGIDHEQTDKDKVIKYKDEWSEGETLVVNGFYRFECDREIFSEFCDCIVKITNEYGETAEEASIAGALKKTINATETFKIKLGAVYILTILYFITKGESPLFDSCAYKAAKAIFNGVKPVNIWYENPSNKELKTITTVINEYKWYLERLFGKSNIPRNYDRALWVYGHNNTIKNRNKEK